VSAGVVKAAKPVRLDGLEVIAIQLAWVFWPATGECLGTVNYAGPWNWRVSTWGLDGLTVAATFPSRQQAFEYLKMQRQDMKATEEDGNGNREHG
jgi:hypothetical protein